MKQVRRLLSVLVVGLLAFGYLASQYAALNGLAPQYAAFVDTSVFKWASLLVLIAAIVLAFVPDREVDPE